MRQRFVNHYKNSYRRNIIISIVVFFVVFFCFQAALSSLSRQTEEEEMADFEKCNLQKYYTMLCSRRKLSTKSGLPEEELRTSL